MALKGPLGSPVTLPAMWIKGNQNSHLPISPCSFSTRGSVDLCVGAFVCLWVGLCVRVSHHISLPPSNTPHFRCISSSLTTSHRPHSFLYLWYLMKMRLLVTKVTNFPLKVKFVICDEIYSKETNNRFIIYVSLFFFFKIIVLKV